MGRERAKEEKEREREKQKDRVKKKEREIERRVGGGERGQEKRWGRETERSDKISKR